MIIVSALDYPWSVIDAAELAGAWPDVALVQLYFRPNCAPNFMSERTSVSTQLNIDDDSDGNIKPALTQTELLEVLKAQNPESVYLRVSPYNKTEHMVASVRRALPDTRLIVEFYDCSMQFPIDALLALYNNDPEQVQAALDGCRVASTEADALVVQMGGEAFAEWQQTISVPVISYFPHVHGPVTKILRTPDQKRRVLSVHNVEAEQQLLTTSPSFAGESVPLLTALKSSENFSLTVLEGKRDAQAALNASVAAHHDMGLCVGEHSRLLAPSVEQARLPHRFMIYVEYGLPVVVESYFNYAATLLREFDAGMIMPDMDSEDMLSFLSAMALAETRQGMFRMKTMMFSRNTKALYDLKKRVFGSHPTPASKH